MQRETALMTPRLCDDYAVIKAYPRPRKRCNSLKINYGFLQSKKSKEEKSKVKEKKNSSSTEEEQEEMQQKEMMRCLYFHACSQIRQRLRFRCLVEQVS